MIALTKTNETITKISFSWAPVPGAVGYVFFADDKRVSNTWDPSKSSITFSKVTGGRYRVDALGVKDSGAWPPIPPPPPPGEIIFRDDFETVYPTSGATPPGLNPNAAPVLNSDEAGLWDRRSWDGNGSAASVKALPGSTEKAIHFPLGAGGGATWASRWDYRRAPVWRFYGFEWYFAPGWSANAGTMWECRYFPWLRGGGPVGLTPHLDVMKLSQQSGYMDNPTLTADYDNGGNSETMGVGTNVKIRATGRGVASDWYIIPKGQMNTGVVHQVIVGVKWTIANDGEWLGYWRRRGESTWNKTVDVKDAVPSEWWGKDSNGKVWSAEKIASGTVPALYNHGLYRGPTSSAADLYLARVIEATSLEMCQSKMS